MTGKDEARVILERYSNQWAVTVYEAGKKIRMISFASELDAKQFALSERLRLGLADWDG